MKKTLIHIVDMLLFVFLLVCILSGLSHVMLRKETLIRFGGFLENPKDYDVLFVGDSHTVNGIYPMELWNTYGLTSYNLSGIGNTIPVTYWITRLALEKATPKVVVIGIKDLGYEHKLTASSGDLHTALDCFPLTKTKADAVWDLTDDPYAVDDDGNSFMEMRLEYLFPLIKYHSRWPDVTLGDFEPTESIQKGGTMVVGLAVPDEYEITEDIGEEDDGYGYQYLRRTIELCQSKNIDVILVNTPYPSPYENQISEGIAYYIAQEYGIPSLDFVYMDYVVDYNTDMYDSFSHLNPSGARKVTDYLGRYLTDHYSLADHRNEPDVASKWNNEYLQYDQYKCWHIEQQRNNPDILLTLLHDMNLSMVFCIPEHSDIYSGELLPLLIQNTARRHLFEEDDGVEWADGLFPLEYLEDAQQSNSAYYLIIDRENGIINEQVGAFDSPVSTSFGKVSLEDDKLFIDNSFQFDITEDTDICIAVYDNLTNEIVNTICIEL